MIIDFCQLWSMFLIRHNRGSQDHLVIWNIYCCGLLEYSEVKLWGINIIIHRYLNRHGRITKFVIQGCTFRIIFCEGLSKRSQSDDIVGKECLMTNLWTILCRMRLLHNLWRNMLTDAILTTPILMKTDVIIHSLSSFQFLWQYFTSNH